MSRGIGRAGNVYGLLTAVKRVGIADNAAKFELWKFKCRCGNFVVKAYSAVKRKLHPLPHCGCQTSKNLSRPTHGYKGTRVYRIWAGMKNRCYNQQCKEYCRYGQVGIKVCDRWHLFEKFIEDMGTPPSDAYSLDRINGKLGYYKANCRWATDTQQSRNASNNVFVQYKGKRRLLVELAEEVGLPYLLVWSRYRKQGWDIKRCLTEPIQKNKSHKKHC